MTDPGSYREPGGSWRPFWLAAAVLAVLVAVDVALLDVVPALVRTVVVVGVLGTIAVGCLSARRLWTVRIDGRGEDAALVVGRERVPLRSVDADHLAAVRTGSAGVDAGAPVLGGGWSVPRGRSGLPLRRTDGRTVLVPTRRPGDLATAILARHPGGSGRPHTDTGSEGTLEP